MSTLSKHYHDVARYAMYGKDIMQEWFTYRYYRLSADLNRPWHTQAYTDYILSSSWSYEYFSYMYNQVGHDYKWWYLNWRDPSEVKTYLNDNRSFISLITNGEPSGFAIIKNETNDRVNLDYFGLMKSVHGQGLGKRFLADIMRLVSYSKNAIWVYTTDLDHPAALPTYKSCGFKIFETRHVSEYYPVSIIKEIK